MINETLVYVVRHQEALSSLALYISALIYIYYRRDSIDVWRVISVFMIAFSCLLVGDGHYMGTSFMQMSMIMFMGSSMRPIR